MKKILSLIVVSFLVTIGLGSVNAEGLIINENAVYLSGDFYGHNSMTIDGSVYSANGNVKFDGSNENFVNGNIILSENKSYIEENAYSKPNISGTVTQISGTEFGFQTKQMIDFPVISNVIESYTAGWYPTPVTVTKDTYFKNLKIDSYLNIDVSQSDIYIVVDKLAIGVSGKIELVGTGNLYLFVNSDITLNGSGSINLGGDHNKVSIITKNSFKIDGGAKVYANLYTSKEIVDFNGSGTLVGNIVSSASVFHVNGGGKIFGTVYTPIADAVVSSSGTINGRLIAKSLDIYGKGNIIYNPSYDDLTIPSNIQKYSLEVEIDTPNAGTVSPDYRTYNYGEMVTITATANEGYKFIGFKNSVSGGMIPDENGLMVVKENESIIAMFAKIEATPVDNFPSGNRVMINCSYAYLYGYGHGDVGAQDDIKREEASALLYRLLKQDDKIGNFVPVPSSFSDVENSRWSKNALMYMKHIGIYSNDNVEPESSLTRGEVAKIICFALRVRPDSNKTISFSDLDTDNANYFYIKALVDAGILKGYDGKIKPDDNIIRAEYITMINRLIGRDDLYNVDNVKPIYPDLVNKGYWAYNDLMRASLSFSEDMVDGFYQIDPSRYSERETIDYN